MPNETVEMGLTGKKKKATKDYKPCSCSCSTGCKYVGSVGDPYETLVHKR